MKPRLIMFDLDGTLVDSVPDLAMAITAMLADLNQAPAEVEQVRLWVGNGAEMLVRRALTKSMVPEWVESELLEQAMARFFNHYQKINGSNSRLYPQVSQTLFSLRQVVPYMAVVTNKPEQFTLPLLSQLELPDFDLIVGGDTLSAKKPDPAQLLYCLDRLSCLPEEALMVGDSASDIKAAVAAGVPNVCVSYGYHQGQDLHALHPDYLIAEFGALLDILDGR